MRSAEHASALSRRGAKALRKRTRTNALDQRVVRIDVADVHVALQERSERPVAALPDLLEHQLSKMLGGAS